MVARPVATRRSSGRSAVAGAERALHQHAIDPAAEFVARGPDGSDHHKTQMPMQLDRGGVGAVANDRHDLPKSFFSRTLQAAPTSAAGRYRDRSMPGAGKWNSQRYN